MSWQKELKDEQAKNSPFIQAKSLVINKKYKFQLLSAKILDEETKEKMKIDKKKSAVEFTLLNEDADEKTWATSSQLVFDLMEKEGIEDGNWFELWRTGDIDNYWGLTKISE